MSRHRRPRGRTRFRGGPISAPPPDPGFTYIFDGTATGSDASFDKWAFAAGTAAQSRPASEGGQGQATLDPVEGAINVGASPFGAYWYPVKPFGDAVFRIQYTVQNTPTSTRNGGVMIRTPEIRYTGRQHAPRVLAQKPHGLQLRRLPGRDSARICWHADTPGRVDDLHVGRRARSVPAGVERLHPPSSTRAPTARATAPRTSPTAGTGPLTPNGNADNHQHWTQVDCGHEIQINETLTGTGPLGGTDPIKTGSIYSFRNLNAQQSGTYKRLDKGVWHEMEIRTIGQQYTILVDGRDDQPVRQRDPEDRLARG